MPEPFKNMMSESVIKDMADHFSSNWAEFEQRKFIATATKDLKSLELKERTNQVTEAMLQHLPPDFPKAGKILLASLGAPLGEQISAGPINNDGITGWAVMPMADYVGLHGQDHFDLSMNLLKEMTRRSSAEFGIRFFLNELSNDTLSVLRTWTTDRDHHVRRLVSEGIRPRLPWAKQLPAFIEDPSSVIELLETLKDDESEYVRRSVANNLNDIAKDHPDLVASIAAKWIKGANNNRQKLVRHACRTLIKNGHKKTLKVLGYGSPKIKNVKIKISTRKVKLGSSLDFSLSLDSDSSRKQALLIDYIIHHQKANGTTSPKVFKWKTMNLPANESFITNKKHTIKKVTTRVYYPGKHAFEVIINGESVGKANFQLLM